LIRGRFVEFKGDVCLIPPNSFALGRSVEYFRIPRNVLTICLGKSTYARCGIIVNVTPFRSRKRGIRYARNQQYHPASSEDLRQRRLCQVLFFESDEECEISYKDKKGKYQAQQGIRATAALVELSLGNAILLDSAAQDANREIGVPGSKRIQPAATLLPA